jgi:hypothetical protein
LFGRRKGLSGRVWRERTVRQTFDVKLPFAKPEELATHDYAWSGGDRCGHGL